MEGVVDRIEDNIAVVELEGDGGIIYVPKEELPPSAKEGSVIEINFGLK